MQNVCSVIVANSARAKFFECTDSIIAIAVAGVTHFIAHVCTPFFARSAINFLSAPTLPSTAGNAS